MKASRTWGEKINSHRWITASFLLSPRVVGFHRESYTVDTPMREYRMNEDSVKRGKVETGWHNTFAESISSRVDLWSRSAEINAGRYIDSRVIRCPANTLLVQSPGR